MDSDSKISKFNYITLAAIAGFLILGFGGLGIPYLVNQSQLKIVILLVFSSCFILLSYFVFFYKMNGYKKTIFMYGFSKENSRSSHLYRVFKFSAALLLVTVPFTLAIIGNIPNIALFANTFNSEQFEKKFQITAIRGAGNAVRLYLVDESKLNHYILIQRGIYLHLNEPWFEGDLVCAQGESSIFGIVIKSVVKNEC